jgi:AcrR family transcriptional regulator
MALSDTIFPSPPRETSPATPTKSKILDAAERLFAEHGFDTPSLRHITSEAGVNLAAVHYHFGSKEALLFAVLERRIGPINQRRFELLEQLLAASSDSPSVEQILDTFVRPAAEVITGEGRQHFPRIMARLFTESSPRGQQLMPRLFGDVLLRFHAALARALPQLSERELLWRMMFATAVMAQGLVGRKRLEAFGYPAEELEAEELIQRVIAFAGAGMRAEIPKKTQAAGSRRRRG